MEVADDEIDPMDLLAPEVCINETDPLMTYNDTEADTQQIEINHNDDIQEIIDVDDESEGAPNTVNGFNHNADADENSFKPGQIPDPYSEEEQLIHGTIYGAGHQSVQFQRLHCTACNAHLGSAPYNQHDRYIHPLLKVLICKSCFDFYGSGDFDKDEDGSELYCRWCGQGGKVLCCARCPCVFCQKCIRVNQGKKALDAVLQSDDWLCFVCNPQQIIRQRITCRALYDYVQNELTTWRPLNRPDILDIDKSMCCKSKSLNAPKRKPLDENFTLKNEKKFKKKKFCINPLSKGVVAKKSTNEKSSTEPNVTDWEAHPEDEVVCTPDLIMIMNFEEGAESVAMEKEVEDEGHESEAVSVVTPVNVIEETSNSSKSKSPSVKKYKAGLKSETMKKKIMKKINQKSNEDMVKSLPDLMPGSYDWFNKTAQSAAEVNNNLTATICSLSDKQGSITTVEGLIKLHNDLQEILGNVVQSIVKVRKDLRASFIVDLKNLKFVIRNTNTGESELNQDDNDVIIIDSNFTEPSVQPALVINDSLDKTTEIDPAGKTHGYIKVKPPSELLRSSLISTQNTPPTEKAPKITPKNAEKTTDAEQKLLDAELHSQVNKEPFENSFENINTTLKSINSSIPEDLLKQMATVKVVLDKKREVNSVKSHSCKGYTPFKLKKIEDNATEKGENQKESLIICSAESSSANKIDGEEKFAEKKQINGIVIDHVAMGTST